MSDTGDEVKNLEARYKRRKEGKPPRSSLFSAFITRERNAIYKRLIQKHFGEDLSKVSLLEIGAGAGGNISAFREMGINQNAIFANELLDDRILQLKERVPATNIFEGNALDISEENQFDIVFQSTVFTSIHSAGFRKALAEKMVRLCKPNGIILWYDFIYNNPSNPDVKKVPRAEVRDLFRGCKIHFQKVTLAPPLGRRIGKWYPLINRLFPFLRTHLIATVQPQG